MKAKLPPVFAPAIRAVFRAKGPSLQNIPRHVGKNPAFAAPYGKTVTGRTPSQPEIQSIKPSPVTGWDACSGKDRTVTVMHPPMHGASLSIGLVDSPADPNTKVCALSGNPGAKLLASTSGTITALKSIRETAKSWYVTYYGEGDKEVRISKEDPRRRVFDNMAEADHWAVFGSVL